MDTYEKRHRQELAALIIFLQSCYPTLKGCAICGEPTDGDNLGYLTTSFPEERTVTLKTVCSAHEPA